MENCNQTDYYGLVEVVDIRNLQKQFYVEDELNIFDMTSLGTLMLLEKSTTRICGEEDELDDDYCLQRLSLAYERLHTIPSILLEGITQHLKILDISHNKFEDLGFLKGFHRLNSLICDHNNITSKTTIPFLPTLELLWMNHCKIEELYPWASTLKQSCPNLKYLSLMKNPFILFYSNTDNQELNYRLYLISSFPYLKHLDDKIVTADEREEAARLYDKPLREHIMLVKTQEILPDYWRVASQTVSMMVSPTPHFSMSEKKNVII